MTEEPLERELDDISLELHPGTWTTETHVKMSFATDVGQRRKATVPIVMVVPHAESPAEAKRIAWQYMRYRLLRLAAICNQRALAPIPGLEVEHLSALLKDLPLPLEFELVAKPAEYFKISLASDTDPAQQTLMLVMDIALPASPPHPREIDGLAWEQMRDRLLRLSECAEARAEGKAAPNDGPSGESIGLLTHGRT